MFTGIIEAVGRISKLTRKGQDMTLTVDSGALDLSDVKLGDSIATNGVCLTVVALTATGYSADVSSETLARSSLGALSVGDSVNLEKAMLPTTRFGGHMVSGHVDGLGEVTSVNQTGRAWEYWIALPPELAKYVALKGSITVDGISLTVNEVNGSTFKLTIVPHTAEQTTIQHFAPGRKVNIEVDVIARYLERLMLGDKAAEPTQSTGVSLDTLARSGFLK
ncbi:riboflavin synthase [Salinivibrio sp. ES.052]|uniref:riboflavin synthase n=1 Tax=Salinivibrio sp. ES.052 TaxID=1882823 RepID=UPI00092AB51E|nr:riboflavin synthase [Salinivibrio sp. ES.052]SIN74925.1 riboflavin synthase alpha chain [Salinivibrio sp. ES.052]